MTPEHNIIEWPRKALFDQIPLDIIVIDSVAALVQSNFGVRHELNILGVPVGKHLS